MTPPEVRLSPDGQSIAYRFEGKRWTVRTGEFFVRYMYDEDASAWTPLLPVPNEDGAAGWGPRRGH